MENKAKNISDFTDDEIIEEAAKRSLAARICEKQKEAGTTVAWQIWDLSDVRDAIKGEYDDSLTEAEIEEKANDIAMIVGDDLEDCSHGWDIINDSVFGNRKEAV